MSKPLFIACIPSAALTLMAICKVGTVIPSRGESVMDGEIVVCVLLITGLTTAAGYIAGKIEGGES